MRTTIEIYFRDLTEEAQKRFLEAAQVETEEDGNWDNVFPIAVVTFGDDTTDEEDSP